MSRTAEEAVAVWLDVLTSLARHEDTGHEDAWLFSLQALAAVMIAAGDEYPSACEALRRLAAADDGMVVFCKDPSGLVKG